MVNLRSEPSTNKMGSQQGVRDFAKMTDVQGSFRDYLSRKLNVHIPKIINRRNRMVRKVAV